MIKNLELGRYTDNELLELTEGDVHGGTTVFCVASVALATWAASFVSDNTCPTTACTTRC
ncbi:class II lanthipeptide, LchA2/BrtA2 family [Cryobacterium sp. Sr3]|uniref:class II lanthipeptide, LchA2/BrtA2 family n=1 Tax=Cryobacterium sp. Sr3 TaxID=1259194 RepID=UPI00106989A7|nr:class II lanthipeptide, LchA2/BrtA2 family [Cryobacterium sp. Sr3]MBC7593383.1 hypothetical protein [Aeromicrobium sp.]TFB53421.1 hypothetical protein E3N94_15000 [Cryobacterium sp. Sr3]